MICPHCARTIAEQDYYTMSIDRDAPGFGELLKGKGTLSARVLAWTFALMVVFVLAAVCFWALGLAL